MRRLLEDWRLLLFGACGFVVETPTAIAPLIGGLHRFVQASELSNAGE